jgi:hypothetical protein
VAEATGGFKEGTTVANNGHDFWGIRQALFCCGTFVERPVTSGLISLSSLSFRSIVESLATSKSKRMHVHSHLGRFLYSEVA